MKHRRQKEQHDCTIDSIEASVGEGTGQHKEVNSTITKTP